MNIISKTVIISVPDYINNNYIDNVIDYVNQDKINRILMTDYYDANNRIKTNTRIIYYSLVHITNKDYKIFNKPNYPQKSLNFKCTNDKYAVSYCNIKGYYSVIED